MDTVIRTRIIKIGNSRGIRIPKLLLDQFGLSEEVEIAAQLNQLVIRPISHPRDGWEEQCRLMAERGDDKLVDDMPASLTRWDDEEWEW
jgi:antitoxin MazE